MVFGNPKALAPSVEMCIGLRSPETAAYREIVDSVTRNDVTVGHPVGDSLAGTHHRHGHEGEVVVRLRILGPRLQQRRGHLDQPFAAVEDLLGVGLMPHGLAI